MTVARAIGFSARECRDAMKARDKLLEMIELMINHFLEREYGDEWTATDVVFMQDIRSLYEELDL